MVLAFIVVPGKFPGGFIGIDLALVLAGYFFSTQVVDCWVDKKQDHWQLFAKYVLRTLGLLLLLTIVAIPLAWLLDQNFLANITSQLAAAFGFSTNFYEIFFGGSFANRVEPHLFLQLWPIAVVFQSTLVMGVLLTLLGFKANAAMTVDHRIKIMRKNLFLVSSILAFASLSYLVIGAILNVEKVTLFYSCLSHSFPYLFGTLVGSLVGGKYMTNSFKRKVHSRKAAASLLLFFAGILIFLLLAFTLNIQQTGTYTWGILAATLLSSFLLIQGKILSEKASSSLIHLEQLANLTFVAYLFFWPAFVTISSKANPIAGGVLAFLIAGALAFVPFFIRQPKIKEWVAPYTKKVVWPSLLVISLLLIGLTVAGILDAPVLSTSITRTAETNLAASALNMTNTNNSLGDYLAEELTADWQSVLLDSETQVDIAIYSPKYNRTFTYTNAPASKTYQTASIVKVAVLTELLHQKEQAGTTLSATEDDYAKQMITFSSNKATTALLNTSMGGYSATIPLFESLGMSKTTANTQGWGLTTTTAGDQLKLLDEIFYKGNYLNEENRAYIQELMGSVAEEQQWGISAGADKFQLKNSWDYTDEAAWTINSIGHVYSDTDESGYIIAILTDNNALQSEGQELVADLAEKAAKRLLG